MLAAATGLVVALPKRQQAAVTFTDTVRICRPRCRTETDKGTV